MEMVVAAIMVQSHKEKQWMVSEMFTMWVTGFCLDILIMSVNNNYATKLILHMSASPSFYRYYFKWYKASEQILW